MKKDNSEAKCDGLSPPKKRRKDEKAGPVVLFELTPVADVWIRTQCKKWALSHGDKETITDGGKLTDNHMNYCQAVLKHQFPGVDGLGYTLLQSKERPVKIKSGLQVIHVKRFEHWVLASNMDPYSKEQEICVYDSVYCSADQETSFILRNLFGSCQGVRFVECQKQMGSNDCGLFVIAMACALLFGINPNYCSFNQKLMRFHLIKCIEIHSFAPFPLVKDS